MESTHEPQLIFKKSGKWSGWFCSHCSWNVPLPPSIADRDAVAETVAREFRLHDCSMSAQGYLKPSA